jgi:MoaA/NifB/PqqE/SkfB family radical SAM enzyme
MKLPWFDWDSWSLPRTAWIQVEVTTRCNAACFYCPRTVYRDAWHDRSISLAAFRRLLPAFRKTRLVHLQGWGEPFLHPDFFTLAALAQEAGCRVSTTTNGTLLDEEKLRQVVASGLDLIAFSLTGLAERHDRARPGASFRQVLAAIQTLNRLKAAAGSATPQIHLAYLLLKSGLPDLERLPQFLENLGVQQAVISTLDFVPTRELAGETCLTGDPAAQKELQARLAATAAAAGLAGVPVHYPLQPPGDRALLCPENPLGGLCVAANGAVSPCVFTNLPVSRATYLGLAGEQPYGPLVFGNLLEQGLGTIWRRPAYANFRRTFFTGRLATPCRQCLKL